MSDLAMRITDTVVAVIGIIALVAYLAWASYRDWDTPKRKKGHRR